MVSELIENIPIKIDEKENRDGKFKILFFPWLLYFLLTTVLTFGSVIYLKLQINSLQKELIEIRMNLSNRFEQSGQNDGKRSSREAEDFYIPHTELQKIQSVLLHGSIPFQHIREEGVIGPWSSTQMSLSFIELKELNTQVEIIQSGTYFIYAQIYYLTSETHNSFQIMLNTGTEDRKWNRSLSICSSRGTTTIGELSCYTALVEDFHSGDRLYLNQIEQNRLIHFSNGCSYFGIVLLRKT